MEAFSSHTRKIALRDSLGCSLTDLNEDTELAGTLVRFHRKRRDTPVAMQVVTPASDRGFLVGVSMASGHRRQIFQDGRSSKHEFGAGMAYLRDFRVDYRADLAGAFDFVLMEVSRAAIDSALDLPRGARTNGFASCAGIHDNVLHCLALTIAAAMRRPRQSSVLFLDQIGVAITTHLMGRYGESFEAIKPRGRRLSALHEARAKEMLRSRLDGTISIGEIAEACQLSHGHFVRAFSETTGKTPLQWFQSQRLAIARSLLLDSRMTLAEIAGTCGFADQSHFTRDFLRVEGQPPGNWRRQARSR